MSVAAGSRQLRGAGWGRERQGVVGMPSCRKARPPVSERQVSVAARQRVHLPLWLA